MKRRLIVIILGLLAVLAVAAVAGGFISLRGTQSARPPCEDLPSRATVEAALKDHTDLQARLEGIDEDVTAAVSTPCEDPDKGLVAIHYRTDDQFEQIGRIMETSGFGVPAQPVKD